MQEQNKLIIYIMYIVNRDFKIIQQILNKIKVQQNKYKCKLINLINFQLLE